ncbi:aminotransferase class I/II-fold pyridoxal phosphate-dependent enzyme [Streptomyces sp. NPDC001606]
MAGNVTSLFRGTGPVDFLVPCNPYFPTPAMFEELSARLHEILASAPSGADTVTAELCALLQLPPACVAMGNGGTELITWIDHLLVRESLAVPVPALGRWTEQPMETGKRVDMFPLQEANGFALDLAQYAEFIRARRTRVAVICNPGNPDGGAVSRQSLVRFMDAMADLDLVVVDESFLEFADAEAEPSVVQDAMLRPNVIVLRSLGKSVGLPGARLGYLVANPALAGRVRAMLPKWNLNSLAEHLVFMLREYGTEYAHALQQIRRDRLEMAGLLAALPGLTVYPSQGNFLFVRLPVGAEGTVVRDRMLAEHRILVRECGDTIGSSSRFLRLVVRPQADVRRLVSGLEQVLYGSGRGAAVPGPSTGTSYSSGTAAVDRLVGSTNGAGIPGAAAPARPLPPAAPLPAAGTGMPLPAATPLADGMPVPAAPQPELVPGMPMAPAPASPEPVPMPAAAQPVPVSAAPQPVGVSGAMQPVPGPGAIQPVGMPGAPQPVPVAAASQPVGVPGASPSMPAPAAPQPVPVPAASSFAPAPAASQLMPVPTASQQAGVAAASQPVPAALAAPGPQSPGQQPLMPVQQPMPPAPPSRAPAAQPAASATLMAPPAASAPAPFAPAPATPTPPGVPARGGLTAAQVRGMTAPAPLSAQGLTPAPATGWPNAQSWPDAAELDQAAG